MLGASGIDDRPRGKNLLPQPRHKPAGRSFPFQIKYKDKIICSGPLTQFRILGGWGGSRGEGTSSPALAFVAETQGTALVAASLLAFTKATRFSFAEIGRAHV